MLSDNNKRIAKNTFFLYLRMFFVLATSLYTTRVVLNTLGVVDYGLSNVICGFVSMFAFLNASMSNGIQRYYNYEIGSPNETSLTSVYNTALLIQLLIAVVIVIVLETVGLWFLNYKMVIPVERIYAAQWIYQLSILSLVVVVMQIPFSAAIMAHEKMNYYAWVSIVEVALKLAFAFALPYIGWDKLIAYGLYSFAATLVSFIMYYGYCKIQFQELKIRLGFNRELFQSMMSFSGWNIFGTFAYVLKGQGLNVLLNAFFGPVVNAARGISGMIMNSIQNFQSNIVVSFRPQLVQSYAQGNHDRVKNLMYSLSKISYIMLYMLSVPIMIELRYVLHLWLGDNIPDYTVPFTLLVLVNMVISSFVTPFSQVVHAVGKMRKYQLMTSCVISMILPISWILLKIGCGPVSVFWVSLIVTIINQVVCMYLLRSIFTYSIKSYMKEVIYPCLIASLFIPILPLLLNFLMEESFLRLTAVCCVSCAITVLASYVFILNVRERQLAIDFISKLRKR